MTSLDQYTLTVNLVTITDVPILLAYHFMDFDAELRENDAKHS